MKHEKVLDDLRGYLELIGIMPTEDQLEALALHLDLVSRANQRINLTRVLEPRDAVRRHVADSLTVLPELDGAESGRLLDMGSGAGFPGIPLAIMTDRTVVLLDSVGKKVRELDIMVSELGLEKRVTAVSARAEEFARQEGASFAVVTARALSELPAITELAAPLLRPGGTLVCMKGNPDAEELRRGAEVARIAGLGQPTTREFDLPEEAGHRTVVTYRRVGSPSLALPRRVGLAQHDPLA